MGYPRDTRSEGLEVSPGWQFLEGLPRVTAEGRYIRAGASPEESKGVIKSHNDYRVIIYDYRVIIYDSL